MKTVNEYIKLIKNTNDSLSVIDQALDDPDLSDEDLNKLINILNYLKVTTHVGNESFKSEYLNEELLESPNVKIYNNELNLIKSQEKRDKLKQLLAQSAYKNIDGPTSSTGKYHPAWANVTKGLSRHTKVVVRLVRVICNAFEELNSDVMIAAAIAHDALKYKSDNDKYTSKEHAKDAATKLREFGLMEEAELVQEHMGKFEGNKMDNFAKKMLHLADYIASQQFIDIKFDSNNNLIENNLLSFEDIFRRINENV